jgi:hypothetical protein
MRRVNALINDIEADTYTMQKTALLCARINKINKRGKWRVKEVEREKESVPERDNTTHI